VSVVAILSLRSALLIILRLRLQFGASKRHSSVLLSLAFDRVSSGERNMTRERERDGWRRRRVTCRRKEDISEEELQS
jgi:hypothetical protein